MIEDHESIHDYSMCLIYRRDSFGDRSTNILLKSQGIYVLGYRNATSPLCTRSQLRPVLPQEEAIIDASVFFYGLAINMPIEFFPGLAL